MSEIDKVEMLIRKSLSEEEKAVSDYLERRHILVKMLDKTDSEDFSNRLNTYIAVLDDIIEEEEIHIGQLRELLNVFNISLEKEVEGKKETVKSYSEILKELDELLED